MIELSELRGPVVVTAVYMLFWYYLLLVIQRGTKYRLLAQYKAEGKMFDRYFGQDPEMLAADRTVGNTHEQMIPFLVALWMCAVFFSAPVATWLGGAYVVLRAGYPLLLGRRVSKVQSRRVALVTIPSYLIVAALLATAVAGALG